ncbi:MULTISPECIES: DUF4192 domain-containing protein [Corynebacterium]|uniref:DUF4192 domain-containing protein n=1 Tax=Corynebacterium hadale TaxID=2026255 RepID=A0A269PAV6_9CORY|nr:MULTISPECIES: DUF4192 domain-containing protein [Corynebacterium]PAJ68110.1 hypothetical protein CIG21_11665 [Corynebacterium hadale]WKC61129.1 hypothetical protein CHAD_11455 [Corynebacterium hadale]
MSTHSQTLTSHGDILANVPGILGFYPQDSLVLAFFKRKEDSPQLSLSPLARLDLDDAVEMLVNNQDQFTAWSDRFGTDAVIAYVVNSDLSAADDLAKFLLSEESPLPTVLAIVQVPEITSGTGWWTIHQQPELSVPRSGEVSEVACSAALQQMILDTGQLPALSRHELEARLDSTEHGIDDTEYRGIIEDVENYDKPILRYELQREYEQATVGISAPTNTRAIRAGLQCFTSPSLRDPLLAALLDEPQEGLEFAESLMRAVPRDWARMRSQVTATVAVLAQATGQTGLAGVAAHRATELSETENFPALVARTIDLGLGTKLITSVYEGAVKARHILFDA